MILLDNQGRLIARTGGYLSPERLLAWLDGSLRRGRSGNIRVSGP
jgi:hypothetical protein